MGTKNPGFLSRAQLEEAIQAGEIERIVTVVPDLYGRLVGKRITGRFFLDETADHGMHVCDYLFACDMEMDPTPGYAFTSWEKGYGDVLCKVDWNTLRRAGWLAKSAKVLCDVFDEESEQSVSVAPRNALKKQVARAQSLGYTAMGASELEFFA